MIRWPGWQRRQTCDGRKWNWISGCSTPARLRMNPPAFTLDVVIKYLLKSVIRDSRSKFLFESGDGFRTKEVRINKQTRTGTQDLWEHMHSARLFFRFLIQENENHLEVRRCGSASSLQEPLNADLREKFEGCVTSFIDVFVDNTSIEYSVLIRSCFKILRSNMPRK